MHLELCTRGACGADNALPFCAPAANAALSLLNLATYLLGRQTGAQARRFEQEGGFSERLYNVRKARCNGKLCTPYLRRRYAFRRQPISISS